MHNHNMMFLLSFSKTFKFKLIFLIVNVVIHVEIVLIDFEWDASQTIIVDLVEDFVNLKHIRPAINVGFVVDARNDVH